ncbi:hypothetical protein C8R44DRAFT_808160 [Mycena epipterygia]|nr:hypothetical protein C8R44DRAFT_808160 [Mycena epipterygia]
MALDIQTATLVSLFVQSILYGLFILLFALANSILLGKKKRAMGINKPMVTASIIMFILATVHIGVDLRRTMDAFLRGKSLAAVNTTSYVLKSTAYCMQTLVGDGFMLFRVYLVWNADLRVCLPILVCFIASIGTGIGTLNGFTRVSSSDPVFVSELQHWIVSFFSLTLFTNFTCTSLIAGRIWWINRRAAQGAAEISGRSLGQASIIIIESGAIYSACLIILLSLYLSGSYAQYILLDGVVQIVGVVFSLVIVRVGLGLSSEATTRTRVTARPFKAAAANAVGAVSTVGNMELGVINISAAITQQHDLYSYKVEEDASHSTMTRRSELDI